MGLFTKDEILLLLRKINDGGFGYSKDPTIALIQGKLSIMLEVESRLENVGKTKPKQGAGRDG